MTSTFQDRLLTELKREVRLAAASAPAPVRRRLFTPARAGFGLASAAAAATAFVVLPGGGATPAYAVERGEDGGIVVKISEWPHGAEQVADFTAELAAFDVAVVNNPPAGYLCQPFAEGTPEAATEDLPPAPEGADTHSYRSVAGGATVIGPEVAESTGPGTNTTHAAGGEAGAVPPLEGGEAEEFTYHLTAGDTVILTEGEGAGSITFIDGACAPVA